MGIHVTFLPDGKTIEVRPGTTVLDASRKVRVQIRTRCGGKAACLMCKIIVKDSDASGLAPMNQNERLKLGGLQEQGYRLSCQAKVVGNVTVSIPEDPLKAAIRKQLEMMQQEDE
ncbi:2Fe-2S iron-sulfur cluster binding domain-containing protein [Paenibacillus sp. LMG 31456]|uniref:2Fe-2S iron-sulfur cluster binding domain-containing protein n=1 Tax=Paenibacillus foliorum TaxID=2654974 RepID=A0A972K389_9BACL|nr:2Fe-2S iron-sulfur cluster-binding protein [Paenibacillus foliorum]NOU97566.1 2Fe-2S iron-sulfur cluster binding domain-containing protein [Paenibacillus foliorum]